MPSKGVLYIVSTPIGNLEDITFRAIRILKESPLIAAEDTRRTKKLLSHYKLETKTISYFEHNSFARIPKLINHLKVPNNINLGVMVNAGDLINNYHYTHKNLLSLFKKRNKKIKFVRLACHFDEIQKLKECLNWLNKYKYEVFVNIMQISEIDKSKVRKICNFLIRNKIKKIYLADSLGSLRIKSFKKICNNL